jgi:hypothetical protein
MMSFAGIPLPDAVDSIVGPWIEANIEPAKVFETAQFFWPKSITGAPLFDSTPWPQRPIVINSFYWPRDASRFARVHFAINEPKLNQIRQAVEPSGTPSRATFIFDDGNNKVMTDLWLLPALPLQTCFPQAIAGQQAAGNLYLLTMVDDRYWWWDSVLQYGVDGLTTKWTDIYDAVSGAIGASITADPIPSAYGIPPVDYSIVDRPVPLYLDAVAFSVGQRIVRDYDGTVKAQNWSTASTSSMAQAMLYRKYAGGKLALAPG